MRFDKSGRPRSFLVNYENEKVVKIDNKPATKEDLVDLRKQMYSKPSYIGNRIRRCISNIFFR